MKHSRPIRSRYYSTLACMATVLAVAACTVDGAGTGATGQKAGSPGPTSSGTGKPQTSSSGIGGSVGDGAGGGSTSPTPTTQPTPTPTPTLTPTQTPVGVPKVLSVRVLPATASINLAPAGGATPLYATTAQLSAEVIFTNSLATDSVTWSSSDSQAASVDTRGLVTAGTKAGAAIITATSVGDTPEGTKATGSCLVQVKADGAANVTLK